MFQLLLWWDLLVRLLWFPWFVVDSVSWYLAYQARYRALVRLNTSLKRLADALEELLERIYSLADEVEREADGDICPVCVTTRDK